MPLGTGLAILAMLGGSDAPKVDYLAHVMGMVAGIVLGFCVAFLTPNLLTLRGKKNAMLQGLSVTIALALIAFSWRQALGADWPCP